jgi:hypothetical protein
MVLKYGDLVNEELLRNAPENNSYRSFGRFANASCLPQA